MAYSKSFTNDEIKTWIRGIWSKFVVGVEPDRLSDYLVEECVISPEQWQKINCDNQTPHTRCRALLHHLYSSPHPRAFLVVYQALLEENHYLVESIDDQKPGVGAKFDIHIALKEFFTNDEIKTWIRGIWSKFVVGVDPEQLSDWLLQEFVITSEQWQKIHSENVTKQSRCRALLHHLYSIPHPRAFIVVYQALAEENHYLLESISDRENHKRAWTEERDGELKMQKDIEAKLHLTFQENIIRDLVPLPGFITVTTVEPDMITFDDDPSQKRAKMPCGHVIGPEMMKAYCRDVLRDGKYKFLCRASNATVNGNTFSFVTWPVFHKTKCTNSKRRSPTTTWRETQEFRNVQDARSGVSGHRTFVTNAFVVPFAPNPTEEHHSLSAGTVIKNGKGQVVVETAEM